MFFFFPFLSSTRENDIYTHVWSKRNERTFFFRGWETQTRRIFLVLDIFRFYPPLYSSLKASPGIYEIHDHRYSSSSNLFSSPLFPSFRLGGEWIMHTRTRTHTHTRDIKKISLPDVDDFLICCKIITLNSIAKVLLGSHFFFFLFKILLTKTEKLG